MTGKIECIQVGRAFHGDGVSTNAVTNINLSFIKGEFTSIVGPSGSGKSTLLSLLGTLDSPTSGKILYDGEEIMKKSKKMISDFRFENIGFIFQQFHLLPTLTALENVLSPLFSRKVSYNKVERAREVLEQVGLADKENSLPSQLSGGQQQRIAIARAIVHKPDWLLADEPTGNLDSETGDRIFELMKQLNEQEGCGVFFVTHDPKLAAKADRIITMKDGSVLSDRKGESIGYN
ncbi:ABC transporter ATP-binding protein [Heyndrickxia camelliae]|uniref:Lipoprotein-releasing system ATP-binding protein LolD n=1 Tax=Heyndrickxia camelliae TaxID=1707093 RepID=A0A2N3LQ90_9BACI|nr:ABC transporter ATP-binding protein [Heyndrickxia camelliae]PKR86737.1 lipoprotein-releasing system ATP-binding protein LolD [Heyndrickxia camelliae]